MKKIRSVVDTEGEDVSFSQMMNNMEVEEEWQQGEEKGEQQFAVSPTLRPIA